MVEVVVEVMTQVSKLEHLVVLVVVVLLAHHILVMVINRQVLLQLHQ